MICCLCVGARSRVVMLNQAINAVRSKPRPASHLLPSAAKEAGKATQSKDHPLGEWSYRPGVDRHLTVEANHGG